MTSFNGQPRPAGTPPRIGAAEPHAMGDIGGGPKHPSDYHADCAVGHLVAMVNPERDSREREQEGVQGTIHAILSLRDAVLELAATNREVVAQQLASNAELQAEIRTAAARAEARRLEALGKAA